MIKSKEITLVKIDDLVPYSKNMNKHTPEQIDRLVKLIEYQGFRDPIIAQKGTNVVAAGHGRLEAARKMGMKEVPVTYQEFENEAQFYAFVVSHNAINSNNWGGGLDLGQINQDFLDLGPELDIDMLGIKDFVIEPIEKLDPLTDEDESPEPPAIPVTRRGDIWLLGNHRLMCGDSTMIDDVEKLMNGEKADMVFTDPPYGMNLETDYSSMKNKDTAHWDNRPKKYRKVIGDDSPFNAGEILPFFDYCNEVFLWGADYYVETIERDHSSLGSWIVWDKFPSDANSKRIGSLFELCWSKQKHKREICRVQQPFGVKAKDRVHPTQKPVQLAEWFFERWGDKKEKIVDLFLGSGSTLIACEKTNRKCFGMELDEHYVSVVLNRWRNYTGKEPVLESTGQTLKELEDIQNEKG